MFRLVQLIHPNAGRRIAAVDGDRCRLIDGYTSVHGIASFVLQSGNALSAKVEEQLGSDFQDYDAIYHGPVRVETPARIRSPRRAVPLSGGRHRADPPGQR